MIGYDTHGKQAPVNDDPFNSCPSCGYDAVEIGESYFDQDVFRCESCGLEFFDGEAGPGWMPAEFAVGDTYFSTVNIRGEVGRMEFRIEKKRGSFMHASVNEQMRGIFELYIFEETEVIQVSKNLIGEAFTLLPYNLVTED
jgi:hypothetical protein